MPKAQMRLETQHGSYVVMGYRELPFLDSGDLIGAEPGSPPTLLT